MSVFKTQCFLFLRDPHGGVEDLDRMQAAGFGGVFCNIGDHPVSDWEAIIRPRALQRGMFCGPWARTQGPDKAFSEQILASIIQCAARWESPLIVNSESELQGTGEKWTSYIAEACAGLDAALSMEAWPYDNVSWVPLADMPVLPQVSSSYGWTEPPVETWWAYGVKCVFPTFGTFGGMQPTHYDLNAPFSLYTGDDCGGNYGRWTPTAYSYVGCKDGPTPTPPDPEEDMTKIGTQDGVTASCNRLRDLDPSGTLLRKQPNGKWEELSALDATPIDKWKAYDKLERALTILVEDHDGAL